MKHLTMAFCFGLLLWGCQERPPDVAERLAQAIASLDLDTLEPLVSAEYADPLGDRATLFTDLEELERSFSRRELRYHDMIIQDTPPPRANVAGRIDSEWIGETTWKVRGQVLLEFIREDQLRLASGLLTELRDIRGLMRARQSALEANDAEAFAPLLHPAYRDGDRTKSDILERLRRDLAKTPIRMRVTNYRVEIRGIRAHLDEHYVLTVAGQPQPPKIARLTLEKSVGRWKISGGLYPPKS